MGRWSNQTARNGFLLLGLFCHIQAPNLLFSLIFLVFLVPLVGNIMMITLIRLDPRLHTPMYFLLSQLSIMDLLYSSNFVPKIATDVLSGKNTISFIYCGIQLIISSTLIAAQCLLLAGMAYVHYVATCHPLHYSVLMCPKVCSCMFAGTWLGALFNSVVHGIYTLNLPYCASREIHLFFCDFPILLKLVCAGTAHYENGIYISGGVLLLISISAIRVSYGQIFSTVSRLISNLGMRKALATCSSHLIVLSLFFGTTVFKYLHPKAYHTAELDEVVSVFYTIITPMLNSLIYSLWNKDVAGALRKILGK